MRAIILGAGRGSRLKALTDDQPKPYAPIGGRRILDWLLQGLDEAGIDDVVFVGGYRSDRVRADYPRLTFRHNPDWETTNILASQFLRRGLHGGRLPGQLRRHPLPARRRAPRPGAPGRRRALRRHRLAQPLRGPP